MVENHDVAHKPNVCVVYKVCGVWINNGIIPSFECSECGANKRVFSGPNTTDVFSVIRCFLKRIEELQLSVIISRDITVIRSRNTYTQVPFYLKSSPSVQSLCPFRFQCIKFDLFLLWISFPWPLPICRKLSGRLNSLRDNFPIYSTGMKISSQFWNIFLILNSTTLKAWNPSRAKCIDWYYQHYQDQFDFINGLLRYCRSDVDVLRKVL